MITISDDLAEKLNSVSQHVEPKLLAWLADVRILDNLESISPSESHGHLILDRDPVFYLPLNKYFDTNDASGQARMLFDESKNNLNMYEGSSSSYPYVLATSPSKANYYVETDVYSQYFTKRVTDDFSDNGYTDSLGYFTFGTDDDLKYFTWSTNNTYWTRGSGEGAYSDPWYQSDAPTAAVAYVNAGGLDGFVDWKSSGTATCTGGILRYVDDQNFLIATSDGGGNVRIYKIVNGTATSIASAAGAPGTTNYYRFKAEGNTFSVYDLGASVPTNDTSGSLMVSAYNDDTVFQTEAAYNVGYGSYSISASGAANIKCTYFAFFMYNHRHTFFDFTGTNFLGLQHAGGYEDNSTIAKTTFSGDFAIGGAFVTDTIASPHTIIEKTVDVEPKIHQWRVSINSSNKILFKILDKDSGSYLTLTSASSVAASTFYTFAIVYYEDKLKMYINGVLDTTMSFTSTSGEPFYPDGELYPGAALYPDGSVYVFECAEGVYGETYGQIMIGADTAGTLFGESSDPHYWNGRIGCLYVLDSGLTSYEVEAISKSMTNTGVLLEETADEFFNSAQVVDGYKEETFSWSISNTRDKYGLYISPNGIPVSVGDSLTGSRNYGWMSRNKSDSNKDIVNDFVSIRFDARPVNKIRLSTGYEMGGINAYTIYYIDEDDIIRSTSSSFTYLSSVSEVDLGAVYNVKEIKIVPTTLWNADDYARIYCIDPIYEVDLSAYVISANLDEIREDLDGTLPLGATSSNTLSLGLNNTSLVFNPFGDSDYAPYIIPDTELFFSLLFQLDDGTYEEVKLGDSFFVDTWGISEGSLDITPEARDYSKYLQEGTTQGYLGQYVSAGKAVATLAKKAGFPARRIHYYEEYFDAMRRLRPYSWYKFNDTEEFYLANNYILDQCGLTSGTVQTSVSLGNSSIIPSDALVVSDQSQRGPVGDSVVFEPSNDKGSAYIPYGSTLDIGKSDASTRYTLIEPNADYSFSMIFKEVSSAVANTTNWVFNHVDGTSSIYGSLTLNMAFDSTALGSTKNRYLQLGICNDTTGTDEDVRSTSNFEFGEVMHVIVLKEGANYKVYVNNVLEIDHTFSDEGRATTSSSVTTCAYIAKNGWGDVQSSSMSFFDRVLTSDEISDLYTAANLLTIPTFRYLYSIDETYWDAMLSFAMADAGMMYFDRNGDLQYEYRNVLHDTELAERQAVVYELADDVNIIEGDLDVEIQVNKVNVNVNGLSSLSTSYSNIWEAETGTSLAVVILTSAIGHNDGTLEVSTTNDPLFLTSGLVKIDDEIISYDGISNNTLLNLQRGQYGTSPAAHATSSTVREARYFEIKYSSSPALAVKYPFITAEWLYDLADIDFYYSNEYKTKVLVSVSSDVSIPQNKDGTLVLLEGTDPVTELDYNFAMVGIPLEESSKSGDENIEVASSDFAENIRRYRLKEMTIDNKFITNKQYAEILANFILSYYASPVPLINVTVHGIPHIQLGDIVEITQYTRFGIANKKYWIIENSISYDGGLVQDLTLHEFVEEQPPKYNVGDTVNPSLYL